MFRAIIKYLYNLILRYLPDPVAVQLMYFRVFKQLPDLKNPKTFNEKMAWRKLFQRNQLFRVYADKIAVKDEIEKLVGRKHIIETLWMGDNPEDIPFENLDFPYVIKVNHSSGGNFFIRSSSDINKNEIVTSLKEQLCREHGQAYREWGYINIPRKVLVERMLDINGDVPNDYKFFVYHGRVYFIQVDMGRFSDHTRSFYNRDWQLLPITLTYPKSEQPEAFPHNLQNMIQMAETIGSQFDFVRVDLYSLPEAIYFGEVTFYPGGGIEAFDELQSDVLFGQPWQVLPTQHAG